MHQIKGSSFCLEEEFESVEIKGQLYLSMLVIKRKVEWNNGKMMRKM